MKLGATDYVMKDKLYRLSPILSRALKEIEEYKIKNKVEKDLIESEERFKGIFENATIGFYRTAPDGRVLMANPKLINMLGYSSIDELMQRDLNVEGYDSDNPRSDFLQLIERDRQVNGLEAKWLSKDNTLLYVRENAIAIRDELGNTLYYEGTVEDITESKKLKNELKDSEIRYRNLFENSSEFLFTLDLKGNFTDVNKAAEILTGYKKSELLKMNFRDYTQKNEHRKLFLALSNVYKTGNPLKNLYFEANIKDKSKKYFEMSVSLLRKGDEVKGFQGSSKDITERKQAQITLEENEERYREIFQFSPDSIIIHDLDMNILDVNYKAVEEFGYSKEELLEKTVLELHPETEQKHSTQVLDAMKKKEMLIVETEFVRKDGSVFLAEATPCKYTLGSKPIIHVVIRDITERKRTEEMIKNSEERLSTILEKSPIPTAVGSSDGSIVSFNKALEVLIGYRISEITNITDWSNKLYPDKEYRDFVSNNIQQALRGEQQECSEFTITCKNGSTRTVDFHTSFFKDGLIIQMIDITERKKAEDTIKSSEERLKILFEFAPDAYYLNDLKGTFIDGNKAAEVLMGYKKEELIGKNFSKLKILPAKEFIKASKHLMKNVQDKAAGPDEIILNRKDGSKVTVEIRTFPVKIKDKTVVLGIAHDITKRKQIEKEIKAKGDFLERLIQQSPLPTFVLDEKGILIIVNEAFLKFYAVPDKDLILGSNALTNPQNIKYGVDKSIKEALKGNEVDIHEMEFISPYDNKKVFTKGKIFPIFTPDEKLTNVVVIQEDITERKHAEEAVKESEERYRSLFEAAFEAIFISEKGVCFEQNSTAEKMFGYTLSEAIGRKGTEWIVPEDREMVMNNMISGYEEPYEATSLRKDGSTFPAVIQAKMMHFKGRAVRITALTDITDRKQAEEALKESEGKYRALLTNINDLVLEIDSEGKFTYVSPQIFDMFGYTQEESIRLSAYDFIHPDDIEKCMKAMENLDKVKHIEYRSRHKDGHYLHVLTSGRYIPDGAGGFKTISVLRDITERKLAEEELKKRMNELEIFNDSMVGRELKIIELKKEINKLLEKSEQKPKYEIPK